LHRTLCWDTNVAPEAWIWLSEPETVTSPRVFAASLYIQASATRRKLHRNQWNTASTVGKK
jgi:hypothetical protein